MSETFVAVAERRNREAATITIAAAGDDDDYFQGLDDLQEDTVRAAAELEMRLKAAMERLAVSEAERAEQSLFLEEEERARDDAAKEVAANFHLAHKERAVTFFSAVRHGADAIDAALANLLHGAALPTKLTIEKINRGFYYIRPAGAPHSVSHEVAARPKAARAAAFGAVASDDAADENVYGEERISSYLPWRPKKHARGPSRSSTPCFCVTIDGLVPEEEWQAPIPVATVKLSDLPDDASG